MMKARYSVHNIGHYGLMFQYYTHFTSPIRRYPDTMVHRLLTRYAEGGRSVSATKYEDLCEHASNMERRQVFIDAAIDGKSYSQVAEEQGVKIGTVMSRLNRARTQLKRELANYAKERGYATAGKDRP